jgi:hypothetical protein
MKIKASRKCITKQAKLNKKSNKDLAKKIVKYA